MSNRQLVEQFLKISRIEKNLSARTLKAYRCDLQAAMKFFGRIQMVKISLEDLRRYLEHLEQRGLQDSSVRRKLATMKVFFSFLENEDLIAVSPARKLSRKFRVQKRLPRVMSLLDIRQLLESAYASVAVATEERLFEYFRRRRDRAMLEILFATGMRIDELVKLNIYDLDFNRQSVLINGKGRKERLLYISSSEVLAAIEEYLRVRARMMPETSALFLNRFSLRLGVHSVGTIFREYSRMAGLEHRFTPHCLRHTMATMLIENGADVRSVQEILGHSRISTTEIYLSVSKRRKQEVLSRFHARNFIELHPRPPGNSG